MTNIDDVIEGLKKVWDAFNGMEHELYADYVFDALELLQRQKWISVKERYPEKEGFYLVSADHGNYLPWIAEMKIFCGVKGFCNGAAMPCVGAWMPLPEPYNRSD